MRRWLRIAILVIVAHGWSEAHAQSGGNIELGLDGGVGMAIFERQTFVTVGFPFQNLRIGLFADDRIEVEPSVAFHRSYVKRDAGPYFGENTREVNQGGAELTLAYHAGGTEDAGRLFVKGGGLALFANGESQFGFEAGLGWKRRFHASSPWAVRFELAVARTFDSGVLEGGWLPTLSFGFSHFSK